MDDLTFACYFIVNVIAIILKILANPILTKLIELMIDSFNDEEK